MKPKYLVIGPSAMGIFAFLGSLSVIDLDAIEEVSGASAGSVLGLFICLGKTAEEILEILMGIDFKILSTMNLVSLINNFGLISLEPIKKVLKELCGDPTFRQLSKKLYITSFCVNKTETEYFSIDTTPDMSVIDAISMSISVPFLFESVKYNNLTYIDGGIVESIPMMAFLNKDQDDVLILQLEQNKIHIPEIKTLKNFINGIVQMTVYNRIVYKTFSKIINFDLGTIDVFDFLMSYDDKLKLYVLGYQTALIHLGLDR